MTRPGEVIVAAAHSASMHGPAARGITCTCVPPSFPGLARLSDKVFTYRAADNGGLGLSNAGLIGSGDALPIDTFFDLAQRAACSTTSREVPGKIGTRRQHASQRRPLLGQPAAARCRDHRSPPLRRADEHLAARGAAASREPFRHGAAARALRAGLERFDFRGIEITPLTTFVPDDGLTLDVDGVRLDLIYVGLAHTAGDVIVHLPGGRRVFTGDVLFRNCAPIGWEEPFARWIAALGAHRRARTADRRSRTRPGVRCAMPAEMRDLPVRGCGESERLFATGASVEEAALKIDLDRTRTGSSRSASCSASTAPTASCAASRNDKPVDFGGPMVIA